MPSNRHLTILLSLGGRIVPVDLNDYENTDTFSYQGMVHVADSAARDDEGGTEGKIEAEKFADEVTRQANQDIGVRLAMNIGSGMILQVLAIGATFDHAWLQTLLRDA